MHRITRDRPLTPEEAAKYKQLREQIADDLPDLLARRDERAGVTDIRRDLFAVKVPCSDGTNTLAWCITKIFREREPAEQFRRAEQAHKHRDYPLVRPLLVHPSQRVVDVYLLAGNEIW
jgi:hypothetical protein